ncbi:MAG TPA: GspH/FimT family pseudopilin [Myxococcota bacterium]|nr:GspH/FimT family pseudopilin [Myxococcota bacterium]
MRGRTHSGFSLVEMAVVVAIFGILAAISSTMLSTFIPTWRTRQAAYQFAADLNHMRMAAIKDNVQYRVTVTAWDQDLANPSSDSVGAWLLQAGNSASSSTAWDTLPVDINGNTSDGAGTVVISRNGSNELPWVSVVEPDIKTVVFSPRGWVDNATADFSTSTSGYLVFTFSNKKIAVDGGTEEWYVMVSRGGVVRVTQSKNDWMPTGNIGTAATGDPTSTSSGYAGGGVN